MFAKTTLRPDRASAAAARRFVADVLVNRGYPDAAVEHAMLVTSEVVTDAVIHARTTIDVAVVASPSMARVEIHHGRNDEPVLDGDERSEEPVWRRLIVNACCEGWGVEPRPQGTCVWFELRP